jgi:hypothetical protein
MFSRKTCYFFVRLKQKYLEPCVFLGRSSKLLRYGRWIRPPNRSLPPNPDHSSGPGRAADNRLAEGSVRAVGRTHKTGCIEIECCGGEAVSSPETRGHSAPGGCSARPTDLRNAVWRNNWPAFAGFAHRFPARSKGSRTASQHSLHRNECLPCLRTITMAMGVAVWLPAASGVKADSARRIYRHTFPTALRWR